MRVWSCCFEYARPTLRKTVRHCLHSFVYTHIYNRNLTWTIVIGNGAFSRVAQSTTTVLIEKCRQIFVDYIHDRPISGKLPLPRYFYPLTWTASLTRFMHDYHLFRSRNQEVFLLLKNLSVLKVQHPQQQSANTIPQIVDKSAVRAFLLSSDTSVLFILYPVLCELLGIVSANEEALLTELVLTCLKRIGSLFEETE